MSSVADICNLGLGSIGVGDEITDPDTETSKEARACRRFYAVARDQMLRDFDWPRLRRRVALTLVAEDPNDQWEYSYRMPANVATMRRVMDSEEPYTVTEAVYQPMALGQDDTGVLIYSNIEDAEAVYTHQEENTERWTPDMVQACGFLLGALIAPQFGPAAVKLGDRSLKLYEWRRTTAWANAANEEKPDLQQDGGAFVRARA